MIYVLAVLLILIAIAWFLSGKSTKPDSTVLFPAQYRELLNAHVDYYQRLDADRKVIFENKLRQFLQETRIEGVGTEITELDRVLIASSAVIPVFGFPDWHYHNLTNVILYPDTFDGEFQFEGGNRNIMGMVGSGYMNGQMLLSRAALMRGFAENNGKENTAVHEFVHLLDKADGATDGVPAQLIAHEYALPWLQMMHKEMHRIKTGHSDLDPYALTNEAEFLAVAAEYFFEKPEQFLEKHPDLYDQLSLIFGQDPAADSI